MRFSESRLFKLQIVWWSLCLLVIGASLPRLLAPATRATPPPALALKRPFPDCAAAHAAGVYDIPSGSPAYSPDQDGDSDGLACEPFRH